MRFDYPETLAALAVVLGDAVLLAVEHHCRVARDKASRAFHQVAVGVVALGVVSKYRGEDGPLEVSAVALAVNPGVVSKQVAVFR